MADKELKDKQEAFVSAYVGRCRFNATAAAREVGYAFPGEEGYRLLKNAHIRSRIDKLLDAEAMTDKEVLAELATVARAPFEVFVDVVSTDKEGVPVKIRFDLGAKVKSLELLGKGHKLFSESVELAAAESFIDALREFGRGRST